MQVADSGATEMPTTLKNATKKYVQARNLSNGTRSEYQTTVAMYQEHHTFVYFAVDHPFHHQDAVGTLGFYR